MEDQAEHDKDKDKEREELKQKYLLEREKKMKGINPLLGAFLCDNPLCQYADQLVPFDKHIQVMSEEGAKDLYRHIHKGRDGKSEFHFCTICHNAIVMVHALNPHVLYNDDITKLKVIPKNDNIIDSLTE